MNNNNCHGHRPPNSYPYEVPAHDSYSGCCDCNRHPIPPGPPPPPFKFPTDGFFKGSAFMLEDTYPYIIDTSLTNYGQFIHYADSVITKVTRRNDPSCIHLAATFDMTNNTMTNILRQNYLEKYIGRKHDILNGMLPVIKSPIKIKVYYTVTDRDGGVLHESHFEDFVYDNRFHFTDVRDVTVQSIKGIITTNIPAMTFRGLYAITIDKVELYVSVIDTAKHVIDDMNPYYAFADNNMKIMLQHETINAAKPDYEIMIASCDVNRTFEYQANVTSRFNMSFVAFMSNFIPVGNTEGVWSALNDYSGVVVDQLVKEIEILKEEVHDLKSKHIWAKEAIATINTNIDEMNKNIETLTESYNDLDKRVSTLEARTLALVSYTAGKEFIPPQITWKTYGDLYQCVSAFTASGDFNADVEDGYLIPVAKGTAEYDELMTRVDELGDQSDQNSNMNDQQTAQISALAEDVDTIKNDLSTMMVYKTFDDLGIVNNPITYPTMLDLYKALAAKNIRTNTIVTGMIRSTQLPNEFNGHGNAEVSIQVIEKSFFCTCTSLDTAPYSWNALYGKGVEVFGWTPTFPNVNSGTDTNGDDEAE